MSSWREWLGLPPRIEDFAHRLRRELRGQGEGEWEYVAGPNLLRGPAGQVMSLANPFLRYRSSGRAERAHLVDMFVAQARASGETVPTLWTLARDRLMPVVRCASDAAFHAMFARLEHGEPMPHSPAVPLAGRFCIRLVCDSELTMTQVKQEHLDTWGQAMGAAVETAMANLRALPRPTWVCMEGGHFQLDSEAGYAESFLLLERVRAQLPFGAGAVFMVPNRGVLLAADGDDEAACLAMLAQTRHGLDHEPWPMSADVIAHHEVGGWRIAKLLGLAGREARELEAIQAAREYGEQQDLIEQLFEREGRDVFVAACEVLERDGAPSTWTTWPQGVHSLLPRTDLLATGLCDDEGAMSDSILLRWEDAEAICPELRQATADYDPPRHEVVRAASDAQWRALQAAALERIGPRGG